MKRAQTKKEIQMALEAQIKAYLSCGGDIKQVNRGESGLSHDKPWINPFKSKSTEPIQTRTPLQDVVASIDARKSANKKTSTHRQRKVKKWIMDDFGEPLRWVWSDSVK